MVTGRQAFSGSDFSEVLAAIIKSEPDWDALPADVPPVLRTCLQRCLHKDSRQRLRDVGDLRLALDGAFDTFAPAQVPSATAGPSRSRLWRWQPVIAAAAILAAGTGIDCLECDAVGSTRWLRHRLDSQSSCPGQMTPP